VEVVDFAAAYNEETGRCTIAFADGIENRSHQAHTSSVFIHPFFGLVFEIL